MDWNSFINQPPGQLQSTTWCRARNLQGERWRYLHSMCYTHRNAWPTSCTRVLRKWIRLHSQEEWPWRYLQWWGSVHWVENFWLRLVLGKLPKGFINPIMKKGKCQFSSLDLVCIVHCVAYHSWRWCRRRWMLVWKTRWTKHYSWVTSTFLPICMCLEYWYSIFFSRIIRDLVAEIINDIGALYKASEAVSIPTCCFCVSLAAGGPCRHADVFSPRIH